uniref:Uncharacterized protein n=1 Tax=Arcella intermedia TaxID=1963864 RepID=A0A6B2LL00_9EUKA
MARDPQEPLLQPPRHCPLRPPRQGGEGPGGRRLHLRNPRPPKATSPRRRHRCAQLHKVHLRPVRRPRRGGSRPQPRRGEGIPLPEDHHGQRPRQHGELPTPPQLEDTRSEGTQTSKDSSLPRGLPGDTPQYHKSLAPIAGFPSRL